VPFYFVRDEQANCLACVGNRKPEHVFRLEKRRGRVARLASDGEPELETDPSRTIK
jgi:hypothetical protein